MLHVKPPPEATLFVDLIDEEDEKTEFTFDELSASAKERARDCYRADGMRDEWRDAVYEDAGMIAPMLGIEIGTRTAKTVGGHSRSYPSIYFSGFASQGDGACFEGYWQHPDHDIVAQIKGHAGQDEKLHEIAAVFAELCHRSRHHKVCATISHSGRYCHEFCTSISVEIEEDEHRNDLQKMVVDALDQKEGMDTFEKDLVDALRSFMRWVYRQLEAEHDYLTSDEAVDEALSDTTFDENGDLI